MNNEKKTVEECDWNDRKLENIECIYNEYSFVIVTFDIAVKYNYFASEILKASLNELHYLVCMHWGNLIAKQ